MPNITIRNLRPSVHLELKSLAEERNISLNALIKSILEQAVVEIDLIDPQSKIQNHMNRNINATNELIYVTKNLHNMIYEQSKLFKKYLG